MKIKPLRPYQKRDLARLERAIQSHRRVLFSATTGYGKTRIAGELAIKARKRGERFIFLAPWRELIPQTITRFKELGIKAVGVMMSGYDADPSAPVIVGSVETVRRWAPEYPELLDAAYILADEAHRYGTDLRQELLLRWPKAKIIGVTATPFRADRGGMGDMFDVLVQGASMQELIDGGFLVPPVFYTKDPESLQSYRIAKNSPARPSFAAKKKPRAKMVGDVIEEWLAIGEGKTLCFANSVQESKEYAQRFRSIGLNAEHIDANTPESERDAILERFAKGKTQIVCNHGVLCEGYDLPNIETVILKRTSSLLNYLQQVGRGLRASDNKKECIVLDPAGNVFRFGFPQEYRTYSLSGAPKEKPLPSPKVEGEGKGKRGAIHAKGHLQLLEQLPNDASSVMKRLEAQAEASGFGMPWAIAEFKRLFDGKVPVGKRYRKETEDYFRRQAKATGLPLKWAKERTRALFG